MDTTNSTSQYKRGRLLLSWHVGWALASLLLLGYWLFNMSPLPNSLAELIRWLLTPIILIATAFLLVLHSKTAVAGMICLIVIFGMSAWSSFQAGNAFGGWVNVLVTLLHVYTLNEQYFQMRRFKQEAEYAKRAL